MKLTTRIAVLTLMFIPGITSAQELTGTEEVVEGLGNIVDLLVPIAFALIVIAFFWGLAVYVMNADDEQAKDRGKSIMIGGVIAMFIAASIWGIIVFLQDELGIEGDQGDLEDPRELDF